MSSRDYMKVYLAIWQDDDFRALPPLAQHLYFVIATNHLSYCGVGDWRPNRLLPLAQGWTMTDLDAAAACLEDQRLFIIDRDTEEVLVRSFMRHDGVMSHNKLSVSAAKAFADVASNTLRGVIVHEMNRLQTENPDWKEWANKTVQGVLKRNSLDPFSEAFREALASRLGLG